MVFPIPTTPDKTMDVRSSKWPNTLTMISSLAMQFIGVFVKGKGSLSLRELSLLTPFTDSIGSWGFSSSSGSTLSVVSRPFEDCMLCARSPSLGDNGLGDEAFVTLACVAPVSKSRFQKRSPADCGTLCLPLRPSETRKLLFRSFSGWGRGSS